MPRKRVQPDLDLTPLIDVLFMLILFFVLSASLLQGQLAVRLPSGQGNPIQGRAVVMELLPGGSLRYDGKDSTREEMLARARLDHAEGKNFIIAADRRVPYGQVASLLEDLRKDGVRDVGLALGGGKAP